MANALLNLTHYICTPQVTTHAHVTQLLTVLTHNNLVFNSIVLITTTHA